MSSAILYVAIVAIWACVLIPRWLRRDPARGTVSTVSATPGETGFPDETGLPGEAGFPDETGLPGEAGFPDETGLPDVADADGFAAPDTDSDGAAESALQPAAAGNARRPARAPLTAEESRRRMLAARRRLLIMLLLLEISAIALAGLGLAAMWVVAPPSVMLVGYLLLLREAAHADAEHAQREADARARSQARERERERIRAARSAAFAEATATATALAAKFAAAPVPADYEDFGPPGRDFAPGLAGKYTPSYADPDPADENDGYDHRLRAVGD